MFYERSVENIFMVLTPAIKVKMKQLLFYFYLSKCTIVLAVVQFDNITGIVALNAQ